MNDVDAMICSLNDFLNTARIKRDHLGRSEGARLVSIAITEAEKSLAILMMAQQRGDLETVGQSILT